ncbi:hypothetical protein GUJ93_ZPchr0014g46645 [Zizania palustris]|uniref:Uncharacterized protein n=1 Tax=Zizania palustris TaxID=103762 RepID=A0A8J5SWT6_ZIZPA|nr:hypothetical protein GUJ93_ZPchr0014g46645 [Zizania palustris]
MARHRADGGGLRVGGGHNVASYGGRQWRCVVRRAALHLANGRGRRWHSVVQMVEGGGGAVTDQCQAEDVGWRHGTVWRRR